ncbi:MAG: succinate dehydrogenase/fumarate reductase iron-sulfur subunit [Aeropyrum sp.]|nr:succinate dehydrogenase/fumarate reductase iron-sulfur subunit [Aeropyrum sp.]MCE4616274.1 succinate dehydrogenase/fumarate reductase iron-sulfur subunit [Aeropyrum sp.]
MAVFDPKVATRPPPRKVKVVIRKYNPETGKAWWQEHEIETYRGMTVLDALLKIKEEQDHTLTLRYSCRMAVCGSCGMTINGTPRLACQTQLAQVASNHNPVVRVEPMYNFKVVKDLLTDFTEFFEKHRKVKPYLIREDIEEQENPKLEYRLTPEEYEEFYQYSLCIACGLCVSACPIFASDTRFLGPQALAQAYRFVIDPRDEGYKVRLELVDSLDGVFGCHFAASCSAVCPKEVDPAAAIQRLRSLLLKYRLKLFRKKINGPVEPLREVKEKVPLPGDAQTLDGVDLEALENQPVVIPVEILSK